MEQILIDINNNFDNSNRVRYYGLRVGDIVRCKFYNITEATVVSYGVLDNNSVIIQVGNSKPIKVVAEWCEVIIRVQDLIVFLNLKDQISGGVNSFAFYNTSSSTMFSFGAAGNQVFSSIEEFIYEFGDRQIGYTRPLSIFLELIPDDYFNKKVE